MILSKRTKQNTAQKKNTTYRSSRVFQTLNPEIQPQNGTKWSSVKQKNPIVTNTTTAGPYSQTNKQNLTMSKTINKQTL